MNPTTDTVDLTTIAISLGRVETKIDHLSGLEERLRVVEEAVTRIEAKDRPRVPWYLVAGGLAGAASAIAFALDFLGRVL